MFFFLWRFLKKAFYLPNLAKTFDGLKNQITAAVNLVTQDIVHLEVNEFSYRLSIILDAGRRNIEHFKTLLLV